MKRPWYREPRLLAVLLGIVLVYGQVLGFAFVDWDDPTYVTENPAVRGGLSWAGFVWVWTASYASNWHPLTWLSHMLDQTLFGSWAGGHHLTSLLLHLANTVLVYGLFRRTTGATGRSAVVAGLFALHPLHVESVAWVSERKDVLSTCGALLAMHAYVDWVLTRRTRSYGFALVAFVMACLAKPMVVTVGLLLLLLDLWPLRRLTPAPWPRLREKLPFLVVAIAVACVTFGAQQHGGAVAEEGALPFAQRLGNVVVSYVVYVWTMVWPVGLAFFYPYRVGLGPSVALAAGGALVVVTGGALWRGRKYPYVAFGWLWYLVTLLPVIGLVQVGDQAMADRYTYLPLVGLFVIVAWGAVDLAARWRLPDAILGRAAAVVIAVCALLSFRQATFWRASVPLFERALAVTHDNYVAHNLLGYIRYDERRFGEAAEHFAAAVAARPTMHEAHSNLGLSLAAQGRFADAIPHYRTALQVRPSYAQAEFNLAIALDRTGAPDAARREVERAIERARQQGDAALLGRIDRWLAMRGR